MHYIHAMKTRSVRDLEKNPISLRRIGSIASSLVLAVAACGARGNQPDRTDAPIDRQALVTRHNPMLRAADRLSPLSLGNGGFAFTADITGPDGPAPGFPRDCGWKVRWEGLRRMP